MRILHLLLFFFCLVQLYAQRTRSTAIQDASKEEPKPVRSRGRSRFTATEEFAQVTEKPSTSNRRTSARTRNQSSSKPAADRRARPVEVSTRGYAVEEINNDSPIDSFIRQSKPRILTENQFEASSADRRSSTYQASSPAPADTLPVEELGFGSTARAILQARGEPLPAKTTTPVVDEEYLLTNFGNTIRTLAGSQTVASRSLPRCDIPIQRATPLRSELPILAQEDIPVRRTSLRAEPLPSLRNSKINLEKEFPARSRNNNSRTRTNARIESERRPSTTTSTTTEGSVIEEYVRLNPETEPPENVQGLVELEIATEVQQPEISSTDASSEDEDPRLIPAVEIFTPRSTYSPPTTRAQTTGRRNGGRSRFVEESSASTAAPRSRGSRTRATRKPDETNASPRARISRRRFDDADVAESRYRGPSVFTVEQYQDVTARARPGRKIDSRFEAVPTRAIDAATVRSRSSGRRATTAGPTSTERPINGNSRGRGRSRSSEVTSSPPVSRSSVRRASLVEKNAGRRSNLQEEIILNDKRPGFVETNRPSSRRATENTKNNSKRVNNIEEAILNEISTRASNRRGNNVESPSRKRTDSSRSESVDSRSSRAQSSQAPIKSRGTSSSSRNVPNRQQEVVEETTIYYGEKYRKTDPPAPEITTIFVTEKPIQKTNQRSRSRFPENPPKLDESKLEVLPLFERETKTTNSVRTRGSRTRSGINKRHGVDHMDASATENDVKFIEKPTTSAFTRVTVTRTESVEASTSRTRLSTRVASSSTTEVPIKRSLSTRAPVTTTKAPETTTRKIIKAPPIIKESVVSEINQVTSKSTITRRKKVPKNKADINSRGQKKADVKLSEVQKKKGSEEDIGEEDNYPEPFKALIQAKKLKEEFKSPPSSSRSAIVQTSTPRVIVTSTPRVSSTTRLVTTSTVAPRKLQKLNELINENENELDPRLRSPSTSSTSTLRPTRSRQLPKFSQKPKQKIEKPKFTVTKSTTSPRKSYSTKSYSARPPIDHHPRRKVLRSTAVPPSTTPLSITKFSAKFLKKENNGEKQIPKGLYSSKKIDTSEENVARKLDVSLIQNAKPIQPIKKFNSSRYSSRYRSDISTRSSVIKPTTSAPFYIPTIPTPAYVPTVPTVTPPVTPVDGIIAVNDADLGVEVISFDDPINTIPSADLVNGEYLTTDKNLKLSPTVKDGTTEKPVSIIERIINSITLISTTEAPNTLLNNLPSPTTTQATGNSAILKLAVKKPNTKDKTDVQTDIIETITSEKPTTIIEKIRSSLSAIQTNEVGTSSTTPLSTVTKYSAKYRGGSVDSTTALPAPLPLSTSVNPLSVFEEINENEVLEQNAIGKLLNILNGLTESPDHSGNFVVVTPKNVNSGFVSTTFLPQEPIEAITLSEMPSSTSSSTVVNTQSTISETTTFVNNDETSTVSDDITSTVTIDSLNSETTTTSPDTTTLTSTIPIRYTETPTSTTSEDLSTSTLYSFPSTIPTVSSFHVDSNRMARLLSTEQRNTDLPRIIITSTTGSSAVTTSTPSSSNTRSSSVNSPPSSITNNTESSTVSSIPSSSIPISSTTIPTSTLPTPTSTSTELPNMVEIIAVPGETRISKSQTTTTSTPESTTEINTPSSEISTDQIFSSTMAQNTETIPPNLGDILNGKTVDALNNLINSEVTSTKPPNFKNLLVNQYNEVLNIQDLINRNNGNVVYRWKPVTKTEYKNIKNSISSTLPDLITTAQSTLQDAPFTSPLFSTERTTFFPSSSDTLLSSTLISTLMPISTTTTTQTTTTQATTTTVGTTTTRRPETTTQRLTSTTTGFPTFVPSTILPTILTTLFPTLLRSAITTPISPISSTRKPLIGVDLSNNVADGYEILSVAGSTARPTTVLPQTSTSQKISTTTTPSTTTTQSTTTSTSTTTQPTTTTTRKTTTTKRKTTTAKAKVSPTSSNKEETDKLFEDLKKSGKLKNLNEEQRKNLEEIERIEKEQAELLKQLSILTTMFGGQNGKLPSLPKLPGGNPVGGSSNSLANRIINMAIERDKSRPTTESSLPTSTTIKSTKSKRPNSIQDQLPITQLEDTTKRVTQSLEDILKQYNLNGLSTELPLTSTYGKTDEAVLAAILKEHGIGPTTPKVLGDKVKEAGLFDESTSTTKKPKPKSKPKPKAITTTTIRPPLGGRLMQGLNWLLDILDPPTTKKPAPRRTKPKTQAPKPAAAEEELLTNQPTRITPMITAAPVTIPNLSQDEIKSLIKQLEQARKNPNAVDHLDLTRLKSLQNLINVNKGVEVTNTGQHGATSRATPRPQKLKTTTEKDLFLTQVNQKPLASTISTLSVSNSIDEDVDVISTTKRTRVMPPVSLNPIPGIDDNQGSMIRGNLLTAAVNVTRAISSFLGSAIQGARKGFQSLLGSGSAMVGNIAQTSSAAGNSHS